MAVQLTETAAREIHQIIQQQELDPAKVRLRVGVKGGGCSGFSYILDLTENERDTDEAWEYEFSTKPVKTAASAETAGDAGGVAVAEGPDRAENAGKSGESFTVRVICDPKSYLYLNGATVDFKDEVMGRGFVFNNPNASTSCGCGSSFAV